MTPFPPHHVALIRALSAAAQVANVPLFIIGGVVRDLLRGAVVGEKDFDFMVVGDAAPFARSCLPYTGGSVKEFPDFLTAKIVAPERVAGLAEIDFTSSRSESYPRPGSLPVVTRGDLAADLARRDFTVNALALPIRAVDRWLEAGGSDLGALRTAVVDRFEGLADLDRGIVRILHPHSFTDDPTRIFRGCRYVVRLQGAFDQATEETLRRAVEAGALTTVSGFRVVTELKKIARESEFPRMFALLEELGVLRVLGFGTINLAERLAALQALALDPTARFDVIARALFEASGDHAIDTFSRLGFGKKQLRHLEVDTTADVVALRGTHVSVAGLWYGVLRGVIDVATARTGVRTREEQR